MKTKQSVKEMMRTDTAKAIEDKNYTKGSYRTDVMHTALLNATELEGEIEKKLDRMFGYTLKCDIVTEDIVFLVKFSHRSVKKNDVHIVSNFYNETVEMLYMHPDKHIVDLKLFNDVNLSNETYEYVSKKMHAVKKLRTLHPEWANRVHEISIIDSYSTNYATNPEVKEDINDEAIARRLSKFIENVRNQ